MAEWIDMKLTLRELYLDAGATLDQVSVIMGEKYNFHPPIRMYKQRFAQWGWRKNTQRGATRLAQKQVSLSHIRHIRSPNVLYNQELVIKSSKTFTAAQLFSNWTLDPFTISQQRYTPSRLPLFIKVQTEVQYVAFLIRNGRVAEAYNALGSIFDFMTGGDSYVHPKFVLAWALAGSVFFDMCTSAEDKDYGLIRALMRFGSANAAAVFITSSPGHPILQLMRAVGFSSGESPDCIREVFRNAAVAAADSLLHSLGPLHPSVLFAFAGVANHWGLSDTIVKRLALQYPIALVRADKELGKHSEVAIGICYDFTSLIFHAQVSELPNITENTPNIREMATNLLQRTKLSALVCRRASQSEAPRAHAFASVLCAMFALQDNELDRCYALFEDAIEWLGSGDMSSFLIAEMMRADLATLTEAWAAGRELRKLKLNVTLPRSFDGEKEINVCIAVPNIHTSKLCRHVETAVSGTDDYHRI
ncbi:hypothetical protein GQ53DRAFT_832878 [Thozetella sp. PMI_491]|nr:hypothetical protein GQ53DRAFT_832878 [Thozetella sp. PMI_491]